MKDSNSNDVPESPPQDLTASNQALVPIEHHADIVEGVQAYRRGDMIFYTVRGEPAVVKKLMGELSRSGVGQVVALISHPAAKPDDEPVKALDESEQARTE